MSKLITFAVFLILCPFVFSIDARIPKHILECYRNNMTEIYKKTQIPMTMNVLIELLQKLEMHKTLDLRLLTTSLIYKAKFDGIQRAPSAIETENQVPVGPSSIHFKKFKLLLNYLLSGNEDLFPMEALTKSEFCTLHKIISSSVQAWERGDEVKTCPQIQMLPDNGNPRRIIYKQQKSSCPIEKGVIKSRWGDISAGHVLLAISAALQNQDVKLMEIVDLLAADEHIEMLPNSSRRSNAEEEINNLWATTLAGDLGEVVAYQQLFVPKIILGTSASGTWNDTLYPRAYYLPDGIGTHWEMTLAESLAGMDGAIIGSQVKDWTQQTGRLRFSQILDMYYSRRGTHFDENFRACQRKENIKKILQDADLVKQTTGMAKLLQYYYQSASSADEWVPIPEEEIEEYVKRVVEEFNQNLGALTDLYSACEKGHDVPPLDIFLVIDGSYTEYEGRRLIGALAQASDVSRFGSRMCVISGTRGEKMTNFTNSVYQIFEELAANEHLWPHSLSLPATLSTINEFLYNKTEKECMDKYRSTRTSVIVIISPTSTLTNADLIKSQTLIRNIKSLNPSTAIVYVTSESTKASFNVLAKNEYLNDKLILSEERIDTIVDKTAQILKDVPAQIIELHCDTDQLHYEDYVLPKITTTYEVSFKIIQETDVKVEFSGHEYGNLSICGGDKAYPEHKVCQWLDDRNSSASFHTKALCQSDEPCTALFKVELVHSRNKCTDDECRYPNQGRIQILTTLSAGSSINSNFIFSAALVLAIVFIHEI